MKFSAPKAITWWIAVVLGVVGILASVVSIGVISTYAVWLIAAGFVLLAAGTVIKGL